MNRRGFLAAAAGAVISPLAAAIGTTKYTLTNSAWTDLGPGPLLLSFRGQGLYAIGDVAPALTGEGFTRARGGSIPINTTSHVWAMAGSAANVDVYVAPITPKGGGGTTSVWSASDVAANGGMTLSNGGLTVTANAGGGYKSVRGTVGKTTGQYYVEFYAVATSSGSAGWGEASSGFIPTNYLGSTPYSAGVFVTGNLVNGFTQNYALAGGTTSVTNDVWALAVDLAAGKIWIAHNNVWQNSSNPATGSLPILSFTPATVGALFPGITLSSAGEAWTLQATAASQKYAPPAGFTPWDGAAAHSAQATAYLARTVGGNEGGNGANIATLIDGLVSDGAWSKLDCLYVLAQQNATDALLNLIGTSYTATVLTAGTFTALRGVTAFSWDSGFNPATAPSPHYTQNSASFGFWALGVVLEVLPQMGNDVTSGIYDYYSPNLFYARVNNATIGSVVSPQAPGLYVGDRESSTGVDPFYNGSDLGFISGASGAPFSHTFYIGNAPTGTPTVQTISAAFIGASLGAAGQLALYNRLRTYLTAIGVP